MPRMAGVGPILAMLAVLAGGFACLYLGFVRTTTGQRIDSAAKAGGLGTGLVAVLDELLGFALWLAAAGAVAAVVVEFARRRFRSGLFVLLVIVCSNVLARVLKLILGRPELGLGRELGSSEPPEWREVASSLPSGHVTLVASLVVAVVAIAPPRTRFGMALGGILAISLTGLAVLKAGWHRPSDVIGSLLVVGFWAVLSLPLLSAGTTQRRASMILTAVSSCLLLAGLLTFVGGGLSHDGPAGISSGWPSTLAYVGSAAAVVGSAGLLTTVPLTRFPRAA